MYKYIRISWKENFLIASSTTSRIERDLTNKHITCLYKNSQLKPFLAIWHYDAKETYGII